MDMNPTAQISASLEKIAHLPQEEQVDYIKTLISDLKGDAAGLISQNAGMRKILRDLENRIAKSDNEWKNISYSDFVYQDKILKERLRRIMDPNCNKNIQVGIIDEDLTPSQESQTLNAKDAIVEYIRELRRAKRVQEKNCRTIRAKWRPWSDEEDKYAQTADDNVLTILSTLLLFFSTLAILGFSYLTHLSHKLTLRPDWCHDS